MTPGSGGDGRTAVRLPHLTGTAPQAGRSTCWIGAGTSSPRRRCRRPGGYDLQPSANLNTGVNPLRIRVRDVAGNTGLASPASASRSLTPRPPTSTATADRPGGLPGGDVAMDGPIRRVVRSSRSSATRRPRTSLCPPITRPRAVSELAVFVFRRPSGSSTARPARGSSCLAIRPTETSPCRAIMTASATPSWPSSAISTDPVDHQRAERGPHSLLRRPDQERHPGAWRLRRHRPHRVRRLPPGDRPVELIAARTVWEHPVRRSEPVHDPRAGRLRRHRPYRTGHLPGEHRQVDHQRADLGPDRRLRRAQPDRPPRRVAGADAAEDRDRGRDQVPGGRAPPRQRPKARR